jgi:hypothetical protein
MLYLDCSCLNLSLRIFPGIFVIFSSIFHAFKTISAFSGIVSGIKNKFEKNKTYPFLPGLSPKAQPAPTRSRPKQGPSGPSRGSSLAGHGLSVAPPLGVRAPHAMLRPRPYKTRRQRSRACPSPALPPPPALSPARVPPAVEPRRRPSSTRQREARPEQVTATSGFATSSRASSTAPRRLGSTSAPPSPWGRPLLYSDASAVFTKIRPRPFLPNIGEHTILFQTIHSFDSVPQSSP